MYWPSANVLCSHPPRAGHSLTLTFGLLKCELAHQLLLPLGTFTLILVFVCPFVFELGTHMLRPRGKSRKTNNLAHLDGHIATYVIHRFSCGYFNTMMLVVR